MRVTLNPDGRVLVALTYLIRYALIMVGLSEGVDETGDRGIDPVFIRKDRQDCWFAQALVGEGKDDGFEGLSHGWSPVGSMMRTTGMRMVEAAVMSTLDS